jgi:hypothetical protein
MLNIRDMKKREIILWVAMAMLVLLNVRILGRYKTDSHRVEVDTTYVCDTIIVHDTIKVVEPKYIAQKVVAHDTVWLPLVEEPTDTMHLANQFADKRTNGSPCDYLLSYVDSVPVVVPITERTYKDRTYKAVVSGYDPKLVSLDIYSEKSVVHHSTVVKKKPKIAVSAGVYGGFGSKGVDYGLGIMVGVPIWSW